MDLKQKVMERVCKSKQQISNGAIVKRTAIVQAKEKNVKRNMDEIDSHKKSKRTKF